MKRKLNIFATFLVAGIVGASLSGCNNEDLDPQVTNLKNVEVLPAEISSDKTLYADVTYQLSTKTYVTNGAVLTVQPGTRIEGLYNENPNHASALIITRGSKIMARGTASNPIVFTAQNGKKGGWGGLVLLGKAQTNKGDNLLIEGIAASEELPNLDARYGGNDDNDNSGVLSYVRVEYAGASISQDNELNAFTFGGVGRGTQLDHLQAYYGADDAFEFFGGCVNAKYLVSTATDDDGLDFDLGYRGTVQFALITIDAAESYSKDPNGIECDNDGSDSDATPFTHPVLSNITIVGTKNGEVAQAGKGTKLKSCANFRRNTQFTLVNSVMYGFSNGILKETRNPNYILEGNVVWANNYHFTTKKDADVPFAVSSTNKTVTKANALGLENPWGNYKSVELRPTKVPATTGFYYLKGIDRVSYKGAINRSGAVWTEYAWVR